MRNSKKAAVVGVSVLALAGAGIAYAAWTSDGSGTGTATAGTAQNLTITPNNPTTGVYPNGTFSLGYTITNPNPYNVTVTQVTPGAITVDATHAAAGCDSTGITASPSNVSTVVLKNGGTNTGSLSFTTDNTLKNACQGATFTFALTSTGASSS